MLSSFQHVCMSCKTLRIKIGREGEEARPESRVSWNPMKGTYRVSVEWIAACDRCRRG